MADPLEYYNNGGTTYTAYAYTSAEKRSFTTDNVESGVYTNLSGSGTAWTKTSSNTTTRTTTAGSVATTIVSTDTKTMDISATAIADNTSSVDTITVGGTTGTYPSGPYYRIDKNQAAFSKTFAHHGKYILFKADGATRHR